MELFKKYMPHISLGVGILVLICLFIPTVSIRVGSTDHEFLGMFAAFGSNSQAFKFDMNYALLIAFLLPILAGLTHFFTKDLSSAKVYQYVSIALFILAGILFFATPALFESITGNVYIENIHNPYFANYGFGAIFAGVFSILAGVTSIVSSLIVE